MIKINNLHISSNPRLIFAANSIENKGKSNKSYTIRINRDGHNIKYLGDLWNSQARRVVKIEARYDIQGLTMLGYLLINSVDKSGADAIFITGNGSLWERLANVNLRDIDYSAWSHVLSLAAVNDSATYLTPAGAYVYDLCDRGQFIQNNDETEGLSKVDITEQYPAIKIQSLVDIILKQFTSATIKSSVVGLSGADTPPILLVEVSNYSDVFANLFLLYTQDNQIRNSNDWLQEVTDKITIVKIDTYTDITGDDTFQPFTFTSKLNMTAPVNGTNVDIFNHEYDIKETGTYRLRYTLPANLVSYVYEDNGEAAVPVKDSGGTLNQTTIKLYFYDEENSEIVYYEEQNLDITAQFTTDWVLDTKFIELTAGSRIALYLSSRGTAQVATGRTSDFLLTVATSYMNTDGSRYYGAGSTVDFSKLVPDMSALTFLSKLFNYLNIYTFYSEETRTLEMIHGREATGVNNAIELIEVTEELQERANYWLRFATDKAAPLDDIYIDNGNPIDQDVSFDFSRTLLTVPYRLYYDPEGGDKVPTLWDDVAKNPTEPRQRYTPPAWKTKGNLRIMRYTGILSGSAEFYVQTYGGGTGANSQNYAGYAYFIEPDIATFHRYDLSLEGTVVKGTAKLRIDKLYDQSYFKYQVYTLDYGLMWLIEAEQIEGNIYKVTLLK